jgi:hypothetical protein
MRRGERVCKDACPRLEPRMLITGGERHTHRSMKTDKTPRLPFGGNLRQGSRLNGRRRGDRGLARGYESNITCAVNQGIRKHNSAAHTRVCVTELRVYAA